MQDGTLSISGYLPAHQLQIWKFVSTFRSRCKKEARAIVARFFAAYISPEPNYEMGTNQEEYHSKVRDNIAKLLDGSSFHQNGLDAQVFLFAGFSTIAKNFTE